MGDIALHGADLLKMVGLAKKRDLNFAYCPGNDPAEDVFVLDRKKKPEILGRVARGEGTGTKIGFGTALVTGKVMTLTCERVLPQTAKKLKRFLKFENIAMNIVVVDLEGNVLEEAIDDAGEAENTDNNEEEDNTNETLKLLKARAVEMQQSLQHVPNTARAPMGKVFKTAIIAMQSGNLDKADAVFSKLETAVDAQMAAAQSAERATPDPALGKLADIAAVLEKRIDLLKGANGVDRLHTAHGVLEKQIATGDVKTAAMTAKALGNSLARFGAHTKASGAQRSQAD